MRILHPLFVVFFVAATGSYVQLSIRCLIHVRAIGTKLSARYLATSLGLAIAFGVLIISAPSLCLISSILLALLVRYRSDFDGRPVRSLSRVPSFLLLATYLWSSYLFFVVGCLYDAVQF